MPFCLFTNLVQEGDVFPAVIVRDWDEQSGTVNLQVHLDGSDTYWATSRVQGDNPGEWQWPPSRCDEIEGEPIVGQLAAMVSGDARHWEDQGALVIYPGALVILNAIDATDGWEDKLQLLPGVKAVRLDDQHIAILLATSSQP
jgi:hypothetical protein